MSKLIEQQYPELWEAVAKALCYCKDHYAQTYLAALSLMSSPEAVRMQLFYTLGNMRHWRGEEAREVKRVFREYIESLKGDES